MAAGSSLPPSAAAALFLHPWRFCAHCPQEAEADLLALMDSHGDATAAGLGGAMEEALAPAQQERLRVAFGWSRPGVLAVFSVRANACGH
jgi:hypothetical protein